MVPPLFLFKVPLQFSPNFFFTPVFSPSPLLFIQFLSLMTISHQLSSSFSLSCSPTHLLCCHDNASILLYRVLDLMSLSINVYLITPFASDIIFCTHMSTNNGETGPCLSKIILNCVQCS